MAIMMVSCDGDKGAALGSGLNEGQGDECILPPHPEAWITSKNAILSWCDRCFHTLV